MSILFSSCGSSQPFQSVTVEEFAGIIADKSIQLIDVRTEEEYQEGHIPGAINIDVQQDAFEENAVTTLDKSKPVALYCRSGKRSKTAADILSNKGYKIYELDNGFLAWESSGNAISK